MLAPSQIQLVDLCTLGNTHFSMAHVHNGDFKPEILLEILKSLEDFEIL